MIVVYVLILVLSFLLLYYFTEYYFIPSLDGIGQRMNMTSDIAGSTLMAIGSSAPELAVMVVSVMKSGHHEAIGVGTIVGSALFNLFVITGVVMLIRHKSRLVWYPLARDLFFYLLAVLILFWSFSDGRVDLNETVVLMAVYGVYLLVLYFWRHYFTYVDREQSADTGEEKKGKAWKVDHILRKVIPVENVFVIFILSVVLISLLAWLLVNSAIFISDALGIPEFVIAIVVIAVGTSVPDLVSSVIVARQGRSGMAINNAVGSNIFDILIGLGLPLFLYIIIGTSEQVTVMAEKEEMNLAFSFLGGSILLLLFFFLVNRWRTHRATGVLLILLYLLYLILEIGGWLRI